VATLVARRVVRLVGLATPGTPPLHHPELRCADEKPGVPPFCAAPGAAAEKRGRKNRNRDRLQLDGDATFVQGFHYSPFPAHPAYNSISG
jgi:hypothetical protein